MAVATAMSAVGLAALIALPGTQHVAGQAAEDSEAVLGADSLHVVLETPADEARLSPGDRVEYTIRVRNSGTEALPDTEVVQFLPSTMRYVTGPAGAEPGEGRVTWNQPLEPGEHASFRVTGEITGVREDGAHRVTTVCLRPDQGTTLASCSAAVHRVYGTVPLVWVVASLLLVVSAAIAVGGYLRYRETRRPRPDPQEFGDHTPGSGPEPDPRTLPGDKTDVHHLDAHR